MLKSDGRYLKKHLTDASLKTRLYPFRHKAEIEPALPVLVVSTFRKTCVRAPRTEPTVPCTVLAIPRSVREKKSPPRVVGDRHPPANRQPVRVTVSGCGGVSSEAPDPAFAG